MPTQPTLGTLLRALLDRLDPAVERAYAEAGLDLRPRFTPVIRVLAASGPVNIKQVAEQCRLSHSALSQTVSAMVARGWVRTTRGADARERILHLTPKARRALPLLQAQWQATAEAAASLDRDLGLPLADVLARALDALEREPFDQRIRARRAAPAERARPPAVRDGTAAIRTRSAGSRRPRRCTRR